MIKEVDRFIASKSLTTNSQKSYFYDLRQFLEWTENTITNASLKRYQNELMTFKASARQRKISAVNQFLYFLYQNEKIAHFYKLDSSQSVPTTSIDYQPVTLGLLEKQDWQHQAGYVTAILAFYFGLLPSEILNLQVSDFDFQFGTLRVQRNNQVRILRLPASYTSCFKLFLDGKYLFDNKGKPYSRQWLFRALQAFLDEAGLSDWTAKKLREQYIINAFAKGETIYDMTKKLGLKNGLTIEKYQLRQKVIKK